MKPAKRDQIVALLQRLADEIEQEQTRRDEELVVREKFFQLLPLAETEMALAFMADQVQETDLEQMADILQLSIDLGCSLVVALSELRQSSEERSDKDKKRIYDTIKKSLAKGFVKDRYGCVVSPMIHGIWQYFLIEKAEPAGRSFAEDSLLLGSKLVDSLRQQCGLDSSVGIGSVKSHIDGIRRSYYEAVFASTYHKTWGNVCRFDDLKLLRTENEEEAAQRPGIDNTSQRTYVELAIRQIREEREQQTWNVLDRAAAFIKEKFHEELSLEEVAEHVHLNPHYFSKVFKQQTGETFIDYLTRLRIEKAKKT